MKTLYFLVVVCVLALVPFIVRSSSIMFKGDKLAKAGKYEEALLYYGDARKAFPLMLGLSVKAKATQVLLNSKIEYGQIDQVYAEVQAVSPVSAPTLSRPLTPGELFVPILMYHHVRINPKPYDPNWAALNTSSDLLEAELAYLVNNNYHVITLDDLQKALTQDLSLPEKPVILTFDDGYENFYTMAFPLLKKYNLKATIFVITQGVENNKAYLTWSQIEEMYKSGLVTIGAHTQHHANLPDLTNSLIQEEIVGSRDDIKKHIGEAPKWFAYPYGSYNNFAIDTARSAGFNGAVSTIYSAIQNKERLYLLPRIMMDGRFSIPEFAKRLQK